MSEESTTVSRRLSPEQRRRLRQRLRRAPAATVPAVDRGGPLPLSAAQERLWFLERLTPGTPLFNVTRAFELAGELDPAALAAALAGVVERHEALRTAFVEHDGVPRQVPAPAAPPALPLVDLSRLAPAAAERRAEREEAAAARRPFDLARPPLLRARLLRFAGDRWRLLLTVHHLVFDGWSLGVLVRELSELYAAALAGRPPRLPALPVQHADVAAWERRRLAEGGGEADLAYWRQALPAEPPLLDLPSDRPRPAESSLAGGSIALRVEPATVAALRRLGRGEGSGLFAVLLAAWAALLGRYSGQREIVVGAPVANRQLAETEGLVGFFVNTLPLGLDLGGDPDGRTLVARAHAAVLGGLEHQAVPFARLVEELAPERSLGHAPLFQTYCALENAPGGGLDLPGVAASGPREVEKGISELDLMLLVAETTDGGLAGSLAFSRDLFDPATAKRIAGHFRRLLGALAEDPGRRLSELPLLGDDERRRLLVEWNDTASAYPRDRGLADLFRHRAAAAPAATAVADGERTLSYGELAARAGRLARRLGALGVGPEVPVGLCFERSAEMVEATLAVILAGGFYVPLDPGYPEQRIAFMLADTGARLVLAGRGAAPPLPAGVRLVELGGEAADDAPGDAASDLDPAAAGPDHLAYVMYTSGSTGRPKGVAVPQRAVLRLVVDAGYARLGPGDRVALVSNPSFDAATFEIWGALLNGAALVVVPRQVALSPAAFADHLEGRRVSAMFLTTSLFNQMVREAPRGLAGLRHLLFGGEAADPGRVGELLAARTALGGPERLINGYGPTETTTFALTHRVRRPPPEGAPLPIGRPIADTRAYVVDRCFEPLATGAPGELVLGGDGLARGYHGRPALTAERFVPDPFGGEPGGRLYRTGDRVRWLAAGAVEFLGRRDHQVKVRGFRVEPGEVEAALGAHPALAACAVTAPRDASGARRLVAYVVPAAGAGAPDPAALRAFLGRELPPYLIPGVYVPLDRLPLNPNGKLDRAALPAPSSAALAGGSGRVAPRTELEELVAGVWSELLDGVPVGAEDDFFALGGHSLLATRAVSRLRAACGVELPLRELFAAPTVAAVARRLDAGLRRRLGGELPPLGPAPPGTEPPLSFPQERLWFLDHLLPERAAYNIPFPFRLTGPFDPGLFARCLAEVARRQASLRSRLPSHAGRPVVRVDDGWGALVHVDLSALPAAVARAEAGRLRRADARRPFDLERGPLFRAALLRLGPDEHLVLLNVHHVVSDGWSMGILVREVAALYAAFGGGAPSPLPEPPLAYSDYAAWQRRWLAGEALDEQLGYWRRQLAGAPALLELPTDRPRPAMQTYRGERFEVELPPALSDRLERLARRRGATLFMLLLAGFQTLLARYSGQTDVLVGTPIAGRRHLETEGLVGFFVNTLVLRGDLSADPGFGALLAAVRDTALGAFAHQDLPFESLVQELEPERSLSHSPLFQVMFALQSAAWEDLSLPGLGFEELAVETGTAKFDLLLSLRRAGDRIVGSLEYACDLFDRTTMLRLVGHYRELLAAAAADPELPLTRLPLLTAGERHELVHELNDTAAPQAEPRLIHHFFEQSLDAGSDAPALATGGSEMGYAELEARANRLARHLRRMGVGPETTVGILVHRSAATVESVLAVLKAGGAFLPLDPAYPEERLAFMLGDSRAEVLITERELADSVPAGARRLLVDDPEQLAAVAAESPERLPDRPAPDNLAYFIYTSGSTGRPKGIAMTHRAFSNLARWQVARSGRRPGARTLQFAPLGFDVSFQEIFTTWNAGGTLVLVDEETRRDARRLLRHLAAERVERLFLPFVALQLLAEEVEASGEVPAALREVVTAGEQLKVGGPLVELFRHLPAAYLENQYGPSEAHVVTAHRLSGDPAAWPALPPVGRPVTNVGAHLLGPGLMPVPLGVPGEIHLSGVNLARGYLDRPGQSAGRFLPDPFSDEPGARLYRTGDRARRLPGGELEFLGRVDLQVKIRGFRVELGEVETVLGEHPAVAEAVVEARDDGGPRRLVAYVVPPAGAEAPQTAELRTYLKERLPDYMVPADFVVLDALPVAATGKVDRKALPAPDRAQGGAAEVPPRTAAERVVADLWRELLEVEAVGALDNFFDLGGHSLHATRHMHRLEELLGIELPVRALFEAQTVEELAARVERRLAEELSEHAESAEARDKLVALRLQGGLDRHAQAEPIARRPGDGPAPLSWSQEILWYVEQQEKLPPSIYLLSPVLSLRGELDEPALTGAFAALVERHEILRTRYGAGEEGSFQVVERRLRLPFGRADLTGLPAERRQTEARRIVEDAARRPFDLTRAPQLRPVLVRIEPRHHWLLITLHHILVDDWAFSVLFRELSALYNALHAGREPELPEMSIQYADYALWDKQRLQGPVLERLQGYWHGRFHDGLPQIRLQTDFPRPAEPSFRGRFHLAQLPAELSNALRRRSREEGVSLFMLLLAAFDLLLYHRSGQPDVLVAIPNANRPRRQAEELIGCFFNLLLTRVDLTGDPTLRELLHQVREVALEAYSHQDFPFILVAPGYQPEDLPPGKPPIQALFSFQNTPSEPIELDDLDVELALKVNTGATDLDLLLSIRDQAEELLVIFNYDTDLFTEATIERMQQELRRLAREIAFHPEKRLSELDLGVG